MSHDQHCFKCRTEWHRKQCVSAVGRQHVASGILVLVAYLNVCSGSQLSNVFLTQVQNVWKPFSVALVFFSIFHTYLWGDLKGQVNVTCFYVTLKYVLLKAIHHCCMPWSWKEMGTGSQPCSHQRRTEAGATLLRAGKENRTGAKPFWFGRGLVEEVEAGDEPCR